MAAAFGAVIERRCHAFHAKGHCRSPKRTVIAGDKRSISCMKTAHRASLGTSVSLVRGGFVFGYSSRISSNASSSPSLQATILPLAPGSRWRKAPRHPDDVDLAE